MKVLVVEDEHRIAKAIKDGLQQESYAVDIYYDGLEGYAAASGDTYDLIITDIMMPGMDGFELCRKLRADGNHTPIMILTAKDQPRDIVAGLDSGADDFLPKPFSFEVLLARVRALMRRPHESKGDIFTIRDLSLDTQRHMVKRAGKQIMLSNKEFGILEYLLRNKNNILSKNNIMSHVWDFDADILPNTVEVFMTYLRAKIEKPFGGEPIITTVRGIGYVIKDDDEEEETSK